jgi:hypothetical protein
MKHQTRLLWTWLCRVKPRPALANHHVRPARFWDFMWHRVVIPYRCIRTPYWLHFQRGKIQKTETKHIWSWQNLLFGRRGTPSITRCLKEAQYIGSWLCLFSVKKHPKLCTLKMGIVTCWDMHLRTNLV